MEGYTVKVINSTKELTPREKIRVKDSWFARLP